MRKVYKCTPEEFYRQDAHIIELHKGFLTVEDEVKEINRNRTPKNE